MSTTITPNGQVRSGCAPFDPQEADELLRRRFAVIQVRLICHPVETWPLAIADVQSISPESLVVTERRYLDRIGQTYAITYDPAHRWYWFPRMRPDEALVFKTYELQKRGCSRWTAHTAFDDPTTAAAARPRESIEICTLVFFEPAAPSPDRPKVGLPLPDLGKLGAAAKALGQSKGHLASVVVGYEFNRHPAPVEPNGIFGVPVDLEFDGRDGRAVDFYRRLLPAADAHLLDLAESGRIIVLEVRKLSDQGLAG